ncbi:MAG: type II secretion system F family protein, partial [Deltaproteobacteria bacterium]|nr:type II secretion system F family protein [Deltaproteobacteria bacterium]
MPQFSYKAADTHGKVFSGTRVASSREELADILKRSGMDLLNAKPVSSKPFFQIFQKLQFGGVTRVELIEFSNNMGVMLKAGIPLVDALVELREDQGNKYFKGILDSVIESIEGGEPFNRALKKHPRCFPAIYANVIEIGENTGRLHTVFFNMSHHLKRIESLNNNARKAMIYPVTVLTILIAVSIFFLVKVFPTMFKLLDAFNVTDYPLMTRSFLWLSTFLQNNLLWVLLGMIAFVFSIYLLRRIETSRRIFDWLELRTPYFSGFFMQLRMAIFARYLSMLQSSGVDIIKSMDLATQSVNNLILESILKDSRRRIMEGNTLSATLRGGSLVPNMVVRMISVGEAAG